MLIEIQKTIFKEPEKVVREGWAEASQAIAAAGDDQLVWPEFANIEDDSWTW